MAQSVEWSGVNRRLGPPAGVDESQCKTLPIFSNGVCCVSCWELDDAEIAEIVRTRRIFLSVWFGKSQPPVLIGSENVVRECVADYGPVWKRER
jgi:hypothetical protein